RALPFTLSLHDALPISARLLGFGDAMQRERGLARAFRAVDFDHPPARETTDAERDVESETSGRNRFDLHGFLLTQLHRRALAECAIDLRERRVERLLTVHVGFLLNQLQFCRHDMASVSCPERGPGRCTEFPR